MYRLTSVWDGTRCTQEGCLYPLSFVSRRSWVRAGPHGSYWELVRPWVPRRMRVRKLRCFAHLRAVLSGSAVAQPSEVLRTVPSHRLAAFLLDTLQLPTCCTLPALELKIGPAKAGPTELLPLGLEGEEHLVTIAAILWMMGEYWWHQSDCLIRICHVLIYKLEECCS